MYPRAQLQNLQIPRDCRQIVAEHFAIDLLRGRIYKKTDSPIKKELPHIQRTEKRFEKRCIEVDNYYSGNIISFEKRANMIPCSESQENQIASARGGLIKALPFAAGING